MDIFDFGKIDKKQVKLFKIKNEKISAEILSLGGIIRSLTIPDKNGKTVDMVLGYDTLEEYLNNDGYFGAVIGRYANRISDASFTLNGVKYSLFDNDNGNCIHGGKEGFNKKIWDYEVLGENTLKLSYLSIDGEEGFPGNLEVSVVYTLNSDGLSIEYFANTDKDTVINLTNHAYFNLKGEGTVYDTELLIDSDKITELSENLSATGRFIETENSPFDFSIPKKIGKDMFSKEKLFKVCLGYDFNYVLSGQGYRKVASAMNSDSGIYIDVYTDTKCMQLYTANFLSKRKGKDGKVYDKHNAFCFETGGYPNSVNIPSFPSAVLRAGDKFYSKTEYKVGVINE